jgi:hypothetical protein
MSIPVLRNSRAIGATSYGSIVYQLGLRQRLSRDFLGVVEIRLLVDRPGQA